MLKGTTFLLYIFLVILAVSLSKRSNAEDDLQIEQDFAEAITGDAVDKQKTNNKYDLNKSLNKNTAVLANMNPDISFILNLGIGWFSHDGHIRQSGHTIDENGFTMQGLEFAVSGSVDPYFRYDMNFEMSHLHMEEVYFTTLSMPFSLQARGGLFNASFGRQNSMHLHKWSFINPSLSHKRFMGEEHFKGLGVELSAILPLPWYSLIITEMFSSKSKSHFASSSFGANEFTKNHRVDGMEDYIYLLRMENFMELSDNHSLNIGLNGTWGQSSYVPDNRAELYGYDLYYKWRPISTGNGATYISITLEYILRNTQLSEDFASDHGGYFQLEWQINRYWVTTVRSDYTKIITGEFPQTASIQDEQLRNSMSITWLPSHFSKIRFQYDLGENELNKQFCHSMFFQIEVSAGEHGAHKF